MINKKNYIVMDAHLSVMDGTTFLKAVHAHNCVLVSKATIIYKNALYGRSFFNLIFLLLSCKSHVLINIISTFTYCIYVLDQNYL